jgi:hypothetical protein
LRYRYQDGTVQGVHPMRVVSDDATTLVGYTPAGTSIMYWATHEGKDPRTVPLQQRFHQPLTTAPRIWQGHGVLRVIPRHEAFQVVHFWDEHGFRGWYVNLESPKTDCGDFLDAIDWHLDLWIGADRVARWKDIDEAEAALAAGHLTRQELDLAWSTGNRIIDNIGDWPGPIGDWTTFALPAHWSALPLPAGWDAPREMQ